MTETVSGRSSVICVGRALGIKQCAHKRFYDTSNSAADDVIASNYRAVPVYKQFMQGSLTNVFTHTLVWMVNSALFDHGVNYRYILIPEKEQQVMNTAKNKITH